MVYDQWQTSREKVPLWRSQLREQPTKLCCEESCRAPNTRGSNLPIILTGNCPGHDPGSGWFFIKKLSIFPDDRLPPGYTLTSDNPGVVERKHPGLCKLAIRPAEQCPRIAPYSLLLCAVLPPDRGVRSCTADRYRLCRKPRRSFCLRHGRTELLFLSFGSL